jgi:hypothetical protein
MTKARNSFQQRELESLLAGLGLVGEDENTPCFRDEVCA